MLARSPALNGGMTLAIFSLLGKIPLSKDFRINIQVACLAYESSS